MEQTTAGAEAPKKRPTFLTVLCILSFVAAGFTIIGGIIGYLGMAAVEGMAGGMAEGMEGAMGEAMAGMESMPGMEEAMALWKYAKVLLIAGSLLTILGLVGVIMMWKLKKMGFYIYTGAQVLGIIVPVVIAGMAAMSWLGVFFSVAFIVMYGLNLKHMS